MMKKLLLKLIDISLICIFGVVFFSSCNEKKYIFGTSSPGDTAIYRKQGRMNFTKGISVKDAWQLVNDYRAKPIPELIIQNISDPDHPKQDSLIAFEIDGPVLDAIRNDSDITGLRIYLGRRQSKNLYTLVIIPKQFTGENYFHFKSSTSDVNAFDWNGPCPYNCPQVAQDFGKNGTVIPK